MLEDIVIKMITFRDVASCSRATSQTLISRLSSTLRTIISPNSKNGGILSSKVWHSIDCHKGHFSLKNHLEKIHMEVSLRDECFCVLFFFFFL